MTKQLRDYFSCPKCNERGYWRTGQAFDHMLRCPNCTYSWDADELWNDEAEQLKCDESDRLHYNTHRD